MITFLIKQYYCKFCGYISSEDFKICPACNNGENKTYQSFPVHSPKKCPNGHLMSFRDGEYVCALCKYFVKKCTCSKEVQKIMKVHKLNVCGCCGGEL